MMSLATLSSSASAQENNQTIVSLKRGQAAPFDGRLMDASSFGVIWNRLQALEASSLELDGELRLCRAEHAQLQALLAVEKIQSERDLALRENAQMKLVEMTAARDARYSGRTVLLVSGGSLVAGALIMLLVVTAD